MNQINKYTNDLLALTKQRYIDREEIKDRTGFVVDKKFQADYVNLHSLTEENNEDVKIEYHEELEELY